MRPLDRTERDELNRLRVQVREQSEELAEWQRTAPRYDGGNPDAEAVRLKVALGGQGLAPYRLLALLLSRPGHTFSTGALCDAAVLNSNLDNPVNLVRVHLCRLRADLSGCGVCAKVVCVWKSGYHITPADCATITAFVESQELARAA